MLLDDELSIGNKRRKGKKYKAEDSAMLVHNSVSKSDITDNLLLKYFRAGMNREGYWNSHHMKVHLQNCVDLLTYLSPRLLSSSSLIKVQVIQNYDLTDNMLAAWM